MIGKFKVITLCGSTRFKDSFIEQQKRLTLEGNIVISVGLFGHPEDNEVWTEGTKQMLDDMNLRKIDMADEIFVINENFYIDESTKREIEYAIKTGKHINYLRELKPKWKIDTKSSENEPKRFNIDERYIRILDEKTRERLRFVEHPDVSPNMRVFYLKIKKSDVTFGDVFETDETDNVWEVVSEYEIVVPLVEARKILLEDVL